MEKRKLLLVEDEEDLAAMVSFRLRAAGYEVAVAYDGEEALEKVKTERPDLIILDLMIPKIDGYQVCDRLKKDPAFSKIPILIFTAKAQQKDIERGKRAGADDYLIKPFQPQDLLEKIRELAQK